jgi:hypothetical protein
MGAFFGKFLIEKNIVDPASVIKALSTQMESQPSTLRILKEKNLMADDKIVEIIAYTSNTGKSLISALKEKNLLSEEQILEIAVERTKSGMSFAEALIEQTNIDPSKIQELLREYESLPKEASVSETSQSSTTSEDERETEINAAALESLKELGMMDSSEIEALEKNVSSLSFEEIETVSEDGSDDGEINAAALESLKELGMMDESELAELEKSVSASTEEIVVEASAENGEGEINAAALESLKELGMLDESQLAELESNVSSSTPEPDSGLVFHGVSGEFLKIFDQETFEKLSEAPKKMAQGLEKEHINEIHQSVSTLLGAARLAGLQFSEKLLDCWDAILTKILNDQINFAEVNMLSISKAFKDTVGLTKDLRDNIEKTNSENTLLTNSDWKNKFMATLKSSLAIAGKR